MVFTFRKGLQTRGGSTVTDTFSHLDPVIVEPTLGGETIETPPKLPFFVLWHGWVNAGELRPNDEPPGPGRLLRVYIHANFNDAQELCLEFAAPLLVATIDHPAPAALFRDHAHAWQARLANDGLPAARVAVIRMAADSYWADRLLGVATEGDPLAAVRDEFVALTRLEQR